MNGLINLRNYLEHEKGLNYHHYIPYTFFLFQIVNRIFKVNTNIENKVKEFNEFVNKKIKEFYVQIDHDFSYIPMQ